MRIGIVSDNHGSVANTMQAVTSLEHHGIETVIHCGDIVSAGTIPLFSGFQTHYVFGNCDHDLQSLRYTIEENGQWCHGRYGELEIASRQVAFLHSDDRQKFEAAIASQQFDLVCYGHTHRYEHHRKGKTLVLNPGALYRADPLSYAIVDLETMDVERVILAKQ